MRRNSYSGTRRPLEAVQINTNIKFTNCLRLFRIKPNFQQVGNLECCFIFQPCDPWGEALDQILVGAVSTYTNFSKMYTRPYTNCSKVVNQFVLFVKINTLCDSTSPVPKTYTLPPPPPPPRHLISLQKSEVIRE